MQKTKNVFAQNVIHENAAGAEIISLPYELLLSRKLFMTGEITEKSMAELIKSLMYLEQISDTEPIELYINSTGGQVLSSIGAYRYMTETMRSPIHTYCIGVASSMASLLYLSGSERYIYEGTTIGLHYPANYEKPEELKDSLLALDSTKDMICRIIADKTGHTFDEISDIIKNGKIYNAEEALNFGLATHIFRKDANDAVDYHNNPFVSRPDESKRGATPPTERYHTGSDESCGVSHVIFYQVPKSLVHIKRTDTESVFRFGFSYRIEEDKIIYANVDINPTLVKLEGRGYTLDLGLPDTKYTCVLSDGNENVELTAHEIYRIYNGGRTQYLAYKVRKSALAKQ